MESFPSQRVKPWFDPETFLGLMRLRGMECSAAERLCRGVLLPEAGDLMHEIKQKTLRGGVAKICAQGANFVLRLGSLMVLGRLLDPKDFGLVGMVTAMIGVFNLFRDFGLSTAAVQRPNVTREQHSTLFWINLVVGVILALVVVAAAPLVAAFYHEPRLVAVTYGSCRGIHFQRRRRAARCPPTAPIALYYHGHRRNHRAGMQLSVGIAMAWAGMGYWALVATTIVPPLVATICFWIATGWIPGRPHRRVGIISMLRFGGALTLNGLIVYVAYNLEKVLLGRYWGAAAVVYTAGPISWLASQPRI